MSILFLFYLKRKKSIYTKVETSLTKIFSLRKIVRDFYQNQLNYKRTEDKNNWVLATENRISFILISVTALSETPLEGQTTNVRVSKDTNISEYTRDFLLHRTSFFERMLLALIVLIMQVVYVKRGRAWVSRICPKLVDYSGINK